jgi:hypothetical protein
VGQEAVGRGCRYNEKLEEKKGANVTGNERNMKGMGKGRVEGLILANKRKFR